MGAYLNKWGHISKWSSKHVWMNMIEQEYDMALVASYRSTFCLSLEVWEREGGESEWFMVVAWSVCTIPQDPGWGGRCRECQRGIYCGGLKCVQLYTIPPDPGLGQVFSALSCTNGFALLNHPRTSKMPVMTSGLSPRISGHTSHVIIIIVVHSCTCPNFLNFNAVSNIQYLPSLYFLLYFPSQF